MNKQKLELTWIGKDIRPNLEPRVLIEDPEKSYHSDKKITDNDLFDNKLVFGDNLLALKALEQEYTGKVKCIYIDPPFNTGAAFEHYDDGIEHSLWLSLMKERLIILRKLLTDDGAIFLHLDDNESAYCKLLLDEVFGRDNYLNQIINSTNKPFGFKSTATNLFKQANHIFLYAKEKDSFKFNPEKLFVEKGYDGAYKFMFSNMDEEESKWKWCNLRDVVARENKFESAKEAKKALGDLFEAKVAEYALLHADSVFRTASVSGGAYLKRKDTIEKSKTIKDRITRHPDDDMNYQFIGGERVLYYKERLQDIDGYRVPVELLTDIWNDISIEGLANEGGVDFPKGKKPEALIKRCISLITSPGDIVLDSFAGSGTTGAVAHKMGRRWIMVELGEHCHTHIIPRMQKVIDGTDQGGISKAVNWRGGGGFRYYRLAPSLLEKDKWGNWVINREYNKELLAEAVCKLEGFSYAPSDTLFWQHGHSTETDFIYVTTQSLTDAQLRLISEEVGESRSLLILCLAYHADTSQYSNLTVKKIPKHVLERCEYGKDDYSLNIQNLPQAEKEEKQSTLFEEEV